ncbi:MAG: ion transporter [Prochlorothrix sp.]
MLQNRSRWMERIDRFIHAPATELALILLILVSVSLVILEVAMGAGSWTAGSFKHIDHLISSIFLVELTCRYAVARRKKRFFRQYWLDIIAILPFSPAFRILRLLRLLRLLRVGILLNRSLSRFSYTLATTLGSQLGLLLVMGLIILVGALGIYLVEGRENEQFDSLSEALWWSFFTLVSAEPIGGQPTTDAGRFMALLVVTGGLTMFAVFTGVVSAVMKQRLKTVMEVRVLELDELQDHIIICGWNRSGHLLVEELQADQMLRHLPLVIVAENIEVPERELRSFNQSQLYFFQGDYTTLDVLENVGIYHASRAILLADATQPRGDQDRDARTVLAALTIEKLNPTIYTCAQLLDRKNNVQLRVAGVEDVVITDELAGHLIATSARNLGAVEVLAELLTVQTGNQFYKINLPASWASLSFQEISQTLQSRHGAILVAIERGTDYDRKILVNPSLDTRMELGDALVIISREYPQI